MTKRQIRQFNTMLTVLRRIAKDYKSSEQIMRGNGGFCLSAEDEIEMAYDNIQSEARSAIKGVREIKQEGGAK